jgi:hypothetical protein
MHEIPCGSLARETENADGARACILNETAKQFYHSNLSSFDTAQSTLGVGGCCDNCFGHERVTDRQGQRRDAVGTEEEELGRFAARQGKYVRLYLYSGKLILAATYLRRAFAVGHS